MRKQAREKTFQMAYIQSIEAAPIRAKPAQVLKVYLPRMTRDPNKLRSDVGAVIDVVMVGLKDLHPALTYQ